MDANNSFDGKVVVITGASSGIGLAIAQDLSRAGAKVVLGARSTEKLLEVVKTLPGEALAVPTDVTISGDVENLIESAIQRFQRIDILVANAGIYTHGDFADGDIEEFIKLIDTNVNGVMRAIKVALVHMLPQGSGDIIVTSSISGHQAIHWEPAYSASKHAVQSLVHGIRIQLVDTGVRIGAVAPGTVLNDIWKITDEATIQKGVDEGMGMRSEDVADAVHFMLTRPRHVNIRDLVMLPTNQKL